MQSTGVYVCVALPSIRIGNIAAVIEFAHVFTRSKRRQTFNPDRELWAKTKYPHWKSTNASKYQPCLEIPPLLSSAISFYELQNQTQHSGLAENYDRSKILASPDN